MCYEPIITRITRSIRNHETRNRMANVVLQVPDISCGHCAKTITEALEHKPGVETV